MFFFNYIFREKINSFSECMSQGNARYYKKSPNGPEAFFGFELIGGMDRTCSIMDRTKLASFTLQRACGISFSKKRILIRYNLCYISYNL